MSKQNLQLTRVYGMLNNSARCSPAAATASTTASSSCRPLCAAANGGVTVATTLATRSPARRGTTHESTARHLCTSVSRHSYLVPGLSLLKRPRWTSPYIHVLPSGQSSWGTGEYAIPDYYRETVVRSNWATGPEERDHWEAVAANFKRPSAVEAAKLLDPQWKHGISLTRLGGRNEDGSRGSSYTPPLGHQYFLAAKVKDPLAVVLVRIGTFYEAVGYDAALLMEYGGYKWVRRHRVDPTIPCVGCHADALQWMLKQLVNEAGLTVAIWEEIDDPADNSSSMVAGDMSSEQRTLDADTAGDSLFVPGASRRSSNRNPAKIYNRKERRCVKLVSPDDPVYLFGYSATSSDLSFEVPDLNGVSLSSTGFNVYVLNRSTNVISVYRNLPQESVWSLLSTNGSKNPVVYLHWPLDQPDPRSGTTASRLEKSYFSLQNQLKDNNARIRKYKSADPLSGFKQRVKQAIDLPQDADLKHLPAWDAAIDWPSVRPLYYSSLCQLGLGFSPGIPSLVAYLLPEDSGGLVWEEIMLLLKNPPPYTVAAAIRRTLKMFESPDLRYWPEFDVSGRVKPEKVSYMLEKGEGNEKSLWNLQGALEPVIIALSSHSDSPVLSALVDSIWPLLCHKMSCQPQELDRNKMLRAAVQAVADIKKVVVPTEHIAKGALPQKPAAGGGHAAVQPSMDYWSKRLEKFRKRVNRSVLLQEYQQVESSFHVASTLMDGLLYSLTQVAHDMGLLIPAQELPYLYTDELNQAALIKLPSADFRQHIKSRPFELFTCQDLEADAAERVYTPNCRQQVLQQPYGRSGAVYKRSEHVYTCEILNQALAIYTDAVTTANEAATRSLQQLSGKLASSKTELVAALKLGILLQTVQEHFKAAKNAGWSLPVVGREEQLQAGIQLQDVAQRGIFRLQGLYPYWMRAGGVSAPVLNDLELDGFMLLTGPNMAGKSTVLRSAAAAALCGCVGLFVPAAPGSLLPELDAILLRTFTADAPIDRLSAFGMEMKEMACVLTDARPASLVLVDELGKGTELAAGTSMTASMLHKLAETGAIGIFATHHHGILEIQQDIPRLVNYSMEVVEQQTAAGHTRLVPTWLLSPGSCTKSLAFDVARDVGMPDDVMQMAEQEHQTLSRLGGTRALFSMAAGNWLWDQPSDKVADDSMMQNTQQADSSRAAGAQGDILGDEAQRRTTSSSPDIAAHLKPSQDDSQDDTLLVISLLTDLGNQVQQLQVPAPGSHSNGSASSSTQPTHPCTVHHIWWQKGDWDVSRQRGAQPREAHSGAAALYAVWLEQTGCWQSGYTENLGDTWKSYRDSNTGCRMDLWYVVLNAVDIKARTQLQQELHQAMTAIGIPVTAEQQPSHKDEAAVPPRPGRRRRRQRNSNEEQ